MPRRRWAFSPLWDKGVFIVKYPHVRDEDQVMKHRIKLVSIYYIVHSNRLSLLL